MDGTGVLMRAAEVEGRAGKQPDGSSTTREVKLCTMWSAEEGTPVRDAGSVSYSAAIERAARRVMLGDGAPWIWKLATEHFFDAVQIVYLFHAKQKLSDVGKSIYGATSDLANAWASVRHGELDTGKLRAIVAALAVHANACDDARRCIGYIWTNRHRMKYSQFPTRRGCAPRRASKRLGARSPSARASSGVVCTGRSPVPTSRFVAASLPAASRSSGRGGPSGGGPRDLHLTILTCTQGFRPIARRSARHRRGCYRTPRYSWRSTR